MPPEVSDTLLWLDDGGVGDVDREDMMSGHVDDSGALLSLRRMPLEVEAAVMW